MVHMVAIYEGTAMKGRQVEVSMGLFDGCCFRFLVVFLCGCRLW